MTTEDIRAELQQNIDEKYRAFHASLVPGIGTFLGVRVPKMREIAKKAILYHNITSILLPNDMDHCFSLLKKTLSMFSIVTHLYKNFPNVTNNVTRETSIPIWI